MAKRDYKWAGVDVEAGYRAVDLMKEHVAKTRRSEVIGGLGGFGGAFSLAAAKNMRDPVLVSGTDGVGTKLKLAFMSGINHTVGIDCVAMCVNDIACMLAEPLFFLDYIACGKNVPEVIADIVKGVSDGCVMAGCSLVGGETAEMPGFYPADEYDLAGFAVGLCERDEIPNPEDIKEGDVLIGIASSGLHSNGFSLVRKSLSLNPDSLKEYIEPLGHTLAEALLTPTRIYVKTLLGLKNVVKIKGAAHITGGGLYENVPRILPEGLMAVIRKERWRVPAIFDYLQDIGNLDEKTMFDSFNMGLGMVLCVSEDEAETAIGWLNSHGEKAYAVGFVEKGKGLRLC